MEFEIACYQVVYVIVARYIDITGYPRICAVLDLAITFTRGKYGRTTSVSYLGRPLFIVVSVNKLL
jgi:hypothetical protein